jgi:hypothetical protein
MSRQKEKPTEEPKSDVKLEVGIWEFSLKYEATNVSRAVVWCTFAVVKTLAVLSILLASVFFFLI